VPQHLGEASRIFTISVNDLSTGIISRPTSV
jgi:hypothetical protein